MLLEWAKGAKKVFEVESETDFGELRRRAKAQIFESLIETGLDYDEDGDGDSACLWFEVEGYKVLFTSLSEYGYPESDFVYALDSMEISFNFADITLDALIAGLSAGTKIVNLTPHAITFYAPDGQTVIQTVPSSGIARAAQTREVMGDINGIPVSKTAYGAVDGLPAPEPGTIYVVSVLTAQAATDRDDLYIVDDLVRDASGAIMGCKALAQI